MHLLGLSFMNNKLWSNASTQMMESTMKPLGPLNAINKMITEWNKWGHTYEPVDLPCSFYKKQDILVLKILNNVYLKCKKIFF